MEHNRYDLGAMLLAALLLLLCVSYTAQCSSAAHRSDTVAAATPAPSTPAKSREEKAERERKPKSVREFAAEEDKEEGQKVQGISRALQTVGANPELRRTLGLPK
jgi:hypothetical protein